MPAKTISKTSITRTTTAPRAKRSTRVAPPVVEVAPEPVVETLVSPSSVKCPLCTAKVGVPCKNPQGQVTSASHVARRRAAERALAATAKASGDDAHDALVADVIDGNISVEDAILTTLAKPSRSKTTRGPSAATIKKAAKALEAEMSTPEFAAAIETISVETDAEKKAARAAKRKAARAARAAKKGTTTRVAHDDDELMRAISVIVADYAKSSKKPESAAALDVRNASRRVWRAAVTKGA